MASLNTSPAAFGRVASATSRHHEALLGGNTTIPITSVLNQSNQSGDLPPVVISESCVCQHDFRSCKSILACQIIASFFEKEPPRASCPGWLHLKVCLSGLYSGVENIRYTIPTVGPGDVVLIACADVEDVVSKVRYDVGRCGAPIGGHLGHP